jgi:hypothetical protein
MSRRQRPLLPAARLPAIGFVTHHRSNLIPAPGRLRQPVAAEPLGFARLRRRLEELVEHVAYGRLGVVGILRRSEGPVRAIGEEGKERRHATLAPPPSRPEGRQEPHDLIPSSWGFSRVGFRLLRRDAPSNPASPGQIASLSSLAGRKAIFLLALIWIGSPVAGLRPIRAARALT